MGNVPRGIGAMPGGQGRPRVESPAGRLPKATSSLCAKRVLPRVRNGEEGGASVYDTCRGKMGRVYTTEYIYVIRSIFTALYTE
jgi:hypothetical protein